MTNTTTEQIWLVEVGLNGWSRLCRTRDEVTATVKEQQAMRFKHHGEAMLLITLSLNGDFYRDFYVSVFK